jgi:hypothetical protein
MANHIKLMLEMDSPPIRDYEQLDRGAKYRTLVEDNRRKRNELIDWLRSNQLDQFVLGIGDATFANYLFLEATRNIESQLRAAPHIEDVSRVKKIEVDLLSINKEAMHNK